MAKYSYIITLQNGEQVYDSKDDNLFFASKQSAEIDASKTIDDIVESQDCEDDDRFMSGDFRLTLFSNLK